LISWIQRSPDGTFSIEVASAGSMNPGNGALTPIAAGFFRWNAKINSTPLADSSEFGLIRSGSPREPERGFPVPLEGRVVRRKWEMMMAVNKPVGDKARKGAVKKRTQMKTKLGGATAWTKRSKTSGEFMAVKKPAKKTKAAKKFKGVRREKKAA
jgi:hypothetical protein